MQQPSPRAAVRRAWNAAALAFAGLICALTLSPETRPGSPTALADQSALLADALRNLVLMAPLAVSLVLAGHRKRVAWLLCSALSAAVELAQISIPGRIAGLNDVAANSLGAGLAIAVLATRARWVSPPPRLAALLGVSAAALPAAVVTATVVLFQPEFPEGTWYGGWNFVVEGMDRFTGPVSSARVGSVGIPPAGPSPDSYGLRRALAAGEPIMLSWGPGENPVRIAPIAIVIGPASEEVLLVAARGGDLVVRRWRRAARLSLEQPEWVWAGAFTGAAVTHGAELVVRPGPHRVDLELSGGARARIWLGAGRGWALLAPDHWVAPGSRVWLDALWLGIVCCPLGVWLPRPVRAVPLVGLALAGLGLAAAQLGLAPAGAAEYGGALAGIAAGAAFARGVRRSSPLSAGAAR